MSVEIPIDPETYDADDRGERRLVLEMDHEAAVERVREALTYAGFGIATEFTPSEMLNEAVDAGRDPYTIIGACNPGVADDALTETDGVMGGLFPCNFAIWAQEDGSQVVYHVSIMKLARLVGLAPNNDAWADIVERTGDYTEEAWAAIDQN